MTESGSNLQFSLTLEQTKYLSWCLLYASWNEHFASADHVFLNSELSEMLARKIAESGRESSREVVKEVADSPTW